MAEKLYLIDGLSQVFRAYYAPFSNLTSPDGEPTKATYVFTNMLLQLIREQSPDYLAMVLEGGDEVPVFRHELDENYKANREPPPEDLQPQINRIIEIIQSQQIPIIAQPGYEADDVLATICHQLADRDLDIVIVSRDKDLDQLLTDKVRMFDPLKKETIGPEELEAKKGYSPDQAIDIQTLTGDTSDNIPGVKGVGPKKALKLIKEYGSVDEIVAHADDLTPALKKNIQAFADQVETTRQLVTLRTDAPVSFDLDQCRFKQLHPDALVPIFKSLGFQRLLDQLDNNPNGSSNADNPDSSTTIAPQTQTERNYVCIDNENDFESFLAKLTKQKRFAFDTETTHLTPAMADLVGLSFCWKAGEAYYLPVRGIGPCLPLTQTLAALKPIFEDPDIEKVGQNLKYDIGILHQHDIQLAGLEFDTMIASFVLDSTRRSHSMDALAREVLNITPIPISDLIGKGKKQISFDSVDTRRACEYAAEDADITWQLAEVFRPQLADSELETLFRNTELPLVSVLARMESTGVAIDVDFLATMSKQLTDRLDQLRSEIHEHAGEPFNIDSPKQLARILFEVLELPVIRRTKTGQSTDADTLDALVPLTDNLVPSLVREYRELSKLKGTYVDTLPRMICARTGRIHASFHQTAAITGRLSSSNPNLQNIPIRTEIGQKIRRAFIPRDDDHLLLAADYSQVELRILAHFCRDQTLIDAFANDEDIHRFVASQVFSVPLEEVSKEQRSQAKAVNFGIVYGQTAYGLSRSTGMPVGQAQAFIDMYFMRYPGIQMFIDETIARARKQGYVQTILGRRRAIPEINSRNKNLRSQGERLAVNTVIQGTAADLIKQAMIHIDRSIREDRRPSKMLIQVHDELVFDIPRDAIQEESAFICEEMTNAMQFDVPLKVDLAWGNNWLESK